MSVVALPKATDKLQQLGRLQDIPAVRQLGLLLTVAAAIALGLWLFFTTQKPSYVPVFAGTDPKELNDAGQLLAQARIEYRLDDVGGLAVPQDQLAQARLALSAAGMPSKSETGFEALNGDQGFGTSQFIENARYQHALESELARTISQLSPVREARVHLAIPKPSAFTRERQPASASVVLQLKNGGQLEPNQVNAIIHLVATSIPNLSPDSVTIVDQTGRMLSNTDPNSEENVSAREQEKQRKREAEYVQRIQELLEPMTGPDRVSTKVSVDMDFSQTEEAREVFGQPSKVRSEQLSEVGNLGNGTGPQGVPGSATNMPDQTPTNAAQAAAGPNNGSRSTVRNYELDRTLTHTRQSPGRVTRVTAAVLVDNIPGTPGKDGKPAALRALTPAELSSIDTLVKQAIGFSEQRGDVVSVVNHPFAATPVEVPESTPFWEHPKAWDYLRLVLGTLAVMFVAWVVLRPTLAKLIGQKSLAVPVQKLDETPEIPVVAIQPQPEPRALPPAEASPTRQAVFDDNLKFTREAVQNDPDRVAQVIRSMVSDHNG